MNYDQISVSSLTSGDPECSSLLEGDACLDPEGFTSPQHGSASRLRRATLDSPGTPSRVFRHNSFSSKYSEHSLTSRIALIA